MGRYHYSDDSPSESVSPPREFSDGREFDEVDYPINQTNIRSHSILVFFPSFCFFFKYDKKTRHNRLIFFSLVWNILSFPYRFSPTEMERMIRPLLFTLSTSWPKDPIQ